MSKQRHRYAAAPGYAAYLRQWGNKQLLFNNKSRQAYSRRDFFMLLINFMKMFNPIF